MAETIDKDAEVRRAADALLNTLWQLAWSGARTQEENWEEMDRRWPQARWLHDALKVPNAAKPRPCTCHPDDTPPTPCAEKYALCDCKAAAEPVAYRHRLAGSQEWNVTNAGDMDGVRECKRHLGDRLEIEPLFVSKPPAPTGQSPTTSTKGGDHG